MIKYTVKEINEAKRRLQEGIEFNRQQYLLTGSLINRQLIRDKEDRLSYLDSLVSDEDLEDNTVTIN
jgi:hypothetical protein